MSSGCKAVMEAFTRALVFLAVSGCGSVDSPPVRLTEHRDSAGVLMYESSGAAWRAEDAWKVDEAPLLDLTTSGTGAAHEFVSVSDAVRLTDGRIIVSAEREIRIFSPQGTLMGRVGRDGDGPGEFRASPQIAKLDGDSIAAYDFRMRRVTLYSPEFDLINVINVREPLADREFVAFQGGFIGLGLSFAAGTPLGLSRTPVPVIAVSRDGQVIDTLTMASGTEIVALPRGEAVLLESPLFGRMSHLALRGDQLALGDATELEFRIVDLSGRRPLRIVRGNKPLLLSEEDIEAEKRALAGDQASPEVPSLLGELVSAIPKPYRRPGYASLQMDVTGAVWLEEYRSESERFKDSAWEVFEMPGVWLGQVVVPGRFRILDIGVDYILGVRLDDLDAEHVQLLSLRR